MHDYQKRVAEESKELADKLEKLNAFIESNPAFEEISIAEQGRMKNQSLAMQLYLNILNDRLAGFLYPPLST